MTSTPDTYWIWEWLTPQLKTSKIYVVYFFFRRWTLPLCQIQPWLPARFCGSKTPNWNNVQHKKSLSSYKYLFLRMKILFKSIQQNVHLYFILHIHIYNFILHIHIYIHIYTHIYLFKFWYNSYDEKNHHFKV